MSTSTHASYALFYTLVDTPKLLICKTYSGVKICKKEARIYCRIGENKTNALKSTDIIIKEIDNVIKLLAESPTVFVNLRPHKLSDNSIHFISDNSNLFYNFVGGGKENVETAVETLRRELDEELFINSNITDKKLMLDNIIENSTYEIISNDKVIFLINYDTLCESVKDFIKNGVINPTIFHKVGKSCGVDVEMGEICSLQWINFAKFCDIIKIKDTIGKVKGGMLNKFNENNILLNELKKIFLIEDIENKEIKNMDSGDYYEKYVKYKNKYLLLKKKLEENIK